MDENDAKTISYQGQLIATIIKATVGLAQKTSFYTAHQQSLQVASHQMKVGQKTSLHTHQGVILTIPNLEEVCYVVRGEVEVRLFTEDGKHIATELLYQGDAVIQHAGAHQYEAKRDSQLFEVKQGPYATAYSRNIKQHDPC